MKKIVITILALLLIPIIVGAADELTLQSGTTIEVNGISLTVGGLVDEMVTDATSVTFTLSANSTLTIVSASRDTLSNNLGASFLCGDTSSQLSVSGTSLGTSFVVSPTGISCQGTSGSSGTPIGGGGAVATPETPTTPITTTGQVTATAASGGKTTLTTDDSSTAAAELPANAVSASTAIAISPEVKETVTASRPTPANRNVVGGYVYDYTATASGSTVSNFDEAVTLTFTYTDEQISGLTESSLRVFYWKVSSSEWIALETTVDTDTNTLTADTTHFTYFAIMALTQGTEDEEKLVEEEPETTIISDGDLIRNPNAEGIAQFDIYIVKLVGAKKFKRLILSPHVFESYEHLNWEDVKDVNQSTIDTYTTSNLVRAVGDDKVYKLAATGDTGTKQWLNMTATQFNGSYDSDSIYEINATDRNAYTTGADVTVGGVVSETIIITVSTLRVRSLPSIDGEILTNISEGEVYDLIDEQDGWYKITANGVTGWCYGGDTGDYAAKQ